MLANPTVRADVANRAVLRRPSQKIGVDVIESEDLCLRPQGSNCGTLEELVQYDFDLIPLF